MKRSSILRSLSAFTIFAMIVVATIAYSRALAMPYQGSFEGSESTKATASSNSSNTSESIELRGVGSMNISYKLVANGSARTSETHEFDIRNREKFAWKLKSHVKPIMYNISQVIKEKLKKIEEKLQANNTTLHYHLQVMIRNRVQLFKRLEKISPVVKSRFVIELKELKSEFRNLLLYKQKIMMECRANFSNCSLMKDYFTMLKNFIIKHLNYMQQRLEFVYNLTNSTEAEELATTIENFKQLVSNVSNYTQLKQLALTYVEIVKDYNRIITALDVFVKLETLRQRVNVAQNLVIQLKSMYPDLAPQLDQVSQKLTNLSIQIEATENQLLNMTSQERVKAYVALKNELLKTLLELRKLIYKYRHHITAKSSTSVTIAANVSSNESSTNTQVTVNTETYASS
jgi:hypothetical protein